MSRTIATHVTSTATMSGLMNLFIHRFRVRRCRKNSMHSLTFHRKPVYTNQAVMNSLDPVAYLMARSGVLVNITKRCSSVPSLLSPYLGTIVARTVLVVRNSWSSLGEMFELAVIHLMLRRKSQRRDEWRKDIIPTLKA
jgi:hypothetical protein